MFANSVRIEYARPGEPESIFPGVFLQRHSQSILTTSVGCRRLNGRIVFGQFFIAEAILDTGAGGDNSLRAKFSNAPDKLTAPMEVIFVFRRFEIDARCRDPCEMNTGVWFEFLDFFPWRFGQGSFEPGHSFACVQPDGRLLGGK